MKNKVWKALGLFGICSVLGLGTPTLAHGAEFTVETSTTLYAALYEAASVRDSAGTAGKIVYQAPQGSAYEVAEPEKDGWIKIKSKNMEGYIQAKDAVLIEKNQEKTSETAKLRKKVVDYALQFVGGRYVYGGINPNTGVDCSGFTRYVMQHAAGIGLSHSSRSQSGEGRQVSYEQARPGDLVFYGKDGSINHVALYMGNGRVVHASTERTGIVVSEVTYRSPVKFVSVLN